MQHTFSQSDEYFKGGASLNVYKWYSNEQALMRNKNPGRDIVNTGKNSYIFLLHHIFQNRLAHSSRKQASKSSDYMAMITVCAVAHYKPWHPGAEWMADCILHWSEDFQGSRRWDKLGHDKEMDILSGPWIRYCDSAVVSECQVKKGSNGEKVSEEQWWWKCHLTLVKVQKKCLVWVELLPRALVPVQSI